MSDIHWRVHITSRCDGYEFTISESACHPGTFRVRVADGQTNAPLWTANSYPTIDAAQHAADDWRTANIRKEKAK